MCVALLTMKAPGADPAAFQIVEAKRWDIDVRAGEALVKRAVNECRWIFQEKT